MENVNDKCPHCSAAMRKWMPPDDSGWDQLFQYVCFNDECPYYIKGWAHMQENYNQKASYRHRFDPHTGDTGPLPVWSANAHRGRIIEDKEA
jgi:Ogr/Delta-like zinc finger protein